VRGVTWRSDAAYRDASGVPIFLKDVLMPVSGAGALA
jgi:hypothetical protein